MPDLDEKQLQKEADERFKRKEEVRALFIAFLNGDEDSRGKIHRNYLLTAIDDGDWDLYSYGNGILDALHEVSLYRIRHPYGYSGK